MLAEMIVIVLLVIVFIIGAQPTVMVYPPDENDCQRVHIHRFWELSTIIDATQCGDEDMNIEFNGKNILEEN